ncbi:hypothetical protein Ddc_22230 [Ditylenchus destructor]|nr:hypothetical protein Ddc_22230 [Ditylenchus destructor]
MGHAVFISAYNFTMLNVRKESGRFERPKAASLTDKARHHQTNKPRTTLTPEQPLLGTVVGRVAPDLLPWNVREQSASTTTKPGTTTNTCTTKKQTQPQVP